jgi:2-alkyl-3-oxoalkanoate reductase
MTVFVTGGTGALGIPTVTRLVRDGHQVKALATSEASARTARAAGAEPVFGSLFDPAFLAAALRGADAVLHLATRIAPFSRASRRSAWRENDRVRADGTRHLVDAALTAQVPTLIYPSFAPVYADGGDRCLSFGDPIAPTDILVSTVDAEREVERFAADGRRGVVLRMATLYGPHSSATSQMLGLARRGISSFVGPAGAYQSLVWDEDAAAALVAAVGTGVSGGYDIADDGPMTRADLAATLADAVGRRHVRRPPTWVARAALPAHMRFLLRSQRICNDSFKRATGWSPRVPDAAQGLGILCADGL